MWGFLFVCFSSISTIKFVMYVYIRFVSKTERFDHVVAETWSRVGKGYLSAAEGLTLRELRIHMNTIGDV